MKNGTTIVYRQTEGSARGHKAKMRQLQACEEENPACILLILFDRFGAPARREYGAAELFRAHSPAAKDRWFHAAVLG